MLKDGRPESRVYWGSDDSQTPILHVDMDSFYASVEVAEAPQLRGLPVIVGGSSARGVVTAATYEARAFGVRAGIPGARARSLCPHGIFLPGRRELYKKYSKKVMELLSEITPNLEPLSIDEAFLDVAGSFRRLGSPTKIAELIRKTVWEELSLPSSVGIAASKSVAKIASNYAKPNGLLLIPKDQSVPFLHSLPVSALWGVGKRTGEELASRGIRTVAQLAHTEQSLLEAWLGAASAKHLYSLAWAKDDREVGPREREKSISTERTFSTNLTAREQVAAFILEASHECAARLRSGGFVGWTVTLKLREKNFRTITRSKTLLGPTDLGRTIADAAIALLDAEPIPAGGVRLAGVGVSSLVEESSGVPIFLDHDPRPRATEIVMDEAQSKYGKNALLPASLINRGPKSDRLNKSTR